jgi:hypothetical protein
MFFKKIRKLNGNKVFEYCSEVLKKSDEDFYDSHRNHAFREDSIR